MSDQPQFRIPAEKAAASIPPEQIDLTDTHTLKVAYKNPH